MTSDSLRLSLKKITMIGVFMISIGLYPACTTVNQQDAGAPSTTAASACQANAAWFKQPQLPTLLNADNFCKVNQVAWQDFFYLVQGDGELVNFVSWKTDDDLFPPTGAPPSWTTTNLTSNIERRDGASQTQRLAGPVRVKARRIANTEKNVKPSKGEGELRTAETLQAGSSLPLTDQNRRWVHYTVYVSRPEYDYIAQCDLYKTACFDSVGPYILLPNQSIELKAAWKIIETCNLPDSPPSCVPESAGSYYTVMGDVAPYGPGIIGPVSATLALVGLHVVHKFPDAPEYVWATFEHRNNAPECDQPHAVGDRSFAFYNAQCEGKFCNTNVFCNSCSQKCSTEQDNFDASCKLPAIPTQVCRESKLEPTVSALNQSVHSLLPQNSVWRNYVLVGSLYKKNHQIYGRDAGSILLSNTTMETYDQRTPGFWLIRWLTGNKNTGCFYCHKAKFTPSTEDNWAADFAHIFRQTKQTGPCSPNLPSFCPTPSGSP